MTVSADNATETPVRAPLLSEGTVVAGKYRVDGLIGVGGMAAVFAAHHLELDQPVAMKILLPAQASRPEAVRRFLHEARSAARLQSPHATRVLDVGTTETQGAGVAPFLVMERLTGADLAHLLKERGPLPHGEAVAYVLEACEAVAEAHALGVVHRDIKPSNLFVTTKRDGAPSIKLLDFGISKSLAPAEVGEDRAVTSDRDIVGSPGYMSPEQVRSSRDVDARTDIWSLGVVLHELLTGVDPFRAETIADTLVAVLHAPPHSIAKLAPAVPGELAEVVMRCLQKKADGRFANVEELMTALAPFRATAALPSPPTSQRALEPPSAEAGGSVHTLHQAAPPRHARLGVWAAAFVLGTVSVLGAAMLLRGSRPADASAAGRGDEVWPPPATLGSPAPLEATTSAPSAPRASAGADAVELDAHPAAAQTTAAPELAENAATATATAISPEPTTSATATARTDAPRPKTPAAKTPKTPPPIPRHRTDW